MAQRRQLTPQQAHEADVADVRLLAARWCGVRGGRRINQLVYRAVCGELENGTNPQSVAITLMNLAFIKRNANKPTDQLDAFYRILHNQVQRSRWWVRGDQYQWCPGDPKLGMLGSDHPEEPTR